MLYLFAGFDYEDNNYVYVVKNQNILSRIVAYIYFYTIFELLSQIR